MEFKKTELSDFAALAGALEGYKEGICDFSAGNLVFWRDYYDTYFYIGNDGFSVMFEDMDGKRCYWCGQDLTLARKIIEREGANARFCCLSENEKNIFLENFECSELTFSDDWSDYIYNSQDIVTLRGKKFSGQRNHINKFKSLYPNYTFSQINKDDIAPIIAFCDDYFSKMTREDEKLSEYEKKYIAELVENLDACPQKTGVLKVDGKIVGFSVGEIVGDQLIIHIEKADTAYQGVYPMLVNLFSNEYAQNIPLINREEDCGVAGLRTSKLSYHPICLLKKYSLVAREK